MRWQVALVLCAGCDALFGLHDRAPVTDAPASGDGATGDGGGSCVAPSTAIYIAPGDYDGDGVPNACDPCPNDPAITFADASNDRDGDGIPDACDPNPDVASLPDCRVFFDGLDDPKRTAPIDPRWATAAAWTYGEGASGLAFNSPHASGETYVYFDITMPMLEQLDVFANISALDGAPLNGFEIFSDAMATPSTLLGASCRWDTTTTAGVEQNVAIVSSGDATQNEAHSGSAYSPGTPIELRWNPTGSIAACTELAPTTLEAKASPLAPVGDRLAINVQDLDFALKRVEAFARCAQ